MWLHLLFVIHLFVKNFQVLIRYSTSQGSLEEQK